jgi:sugar phosphate permease
VVGFVLLYIAFCISYIDRAAISIALAQIRKDFNLQAAELGIIISAFFLRYALMQVRGAMAVEVASTINTAEARLAPSLA